MPFMLILLGSIVPVPGFVAGEGAELRAVSVRWRDIGESGGDDEARSSHRLLWWSEEGGVLKASRSDSESEDR